MTMSSINQGLAEAEQSKQDLIERLKAQATAHRYMAETESADLIDEAIAVISGIDGKPSA